jgi:3-phenylpropionate/trans-cinnamate dioxygenase ferredoxin reductase component
VAARNILGAGVPFDDIHWFWSDQYDTSIQMAGHALTHDEVVLRGSTEARSFAAFFLKDGAVAQVLGIDRNREVRRAMPLIRAGSPVDPAALADDAVDLRTLHPKE